MTAAATTEPEKLTTADLQQAISNKYGKDGQHAVFFDVPDAVGTKARRRADAIVLGMWGSTGNSIIGFEMKSSRSDWLREVKKVDKADPFLSVCDYWWLVTTDRSIAKLEEIPASWGWMSATKHGLRVEKPAQRLNEVRNGPVDRMFALGLIRKAKESTLSSPEVQVVIRKIQDQHEEEIKQRVDSRTDLNSMESKRLQERITAFESKSGLKINDWDLGTLGSIVKAIRNMGGGLNAVAQRLEGEQAVLERLIEDIRQARTAIAEHHDTV